MTPRMHDPSMNTSATLSERHAALIVESAIDYAIVGLDVAGVITSWNEGARRIMGWSREEAIGRHVELFFTPEDRTDRIADAEMRAALRHGRGIDERWHLRKDDTRFWANGEMMPLVSADGNHEGYVKILRDRTEQHDAAAALSESEDRYRSLYDAIDEGFCLIEVRCDDTARPIDFRFLEVNTAFERQTGIVDAPGSWMRDIAPDHEQYWFDVYAKVALTGEPVRFTLPAQALNGRWYEVFAYRVGEPTDRQVAILFSDISERRGREARLAASDEHLRTANATLRDSEANLRRLIDTIDEGFYAVDRDGVTTMCNAAFLKMLGFASAGDVVGRKLHDLIHHSHPDGSAYAASECPIYIAASTGRAAHVVEEQFFPLEGPPVWVEYRATPVVRGGELQGAICTFQNINARRDSERQRAKAERRRTAILDLGDRLRNIIDIAEMGHVAGEVIGKTLNVDGAGYGRIEGGGTYADIVRDWSAPGLPGLSGRHAMRDFGSYVDDLIRGDVVVIEDAHADPRTAANVAAWSVIGIGALVNVPIVEMGELVAIIFVTARETRHWTAGEVDFIRDVGDRTRAAIERRRAEERLQALADTLQEQVETRTQERDRIWQVSRDMLGVADENGVWLSINPAWTDILGWSADEIVGRTSEWMEHPDDSARTRDEVAGLATGKPTLAFENRFRAQDGTYRALSWTAVPVGGLLYCVARDVSEQKAREAELSRTEDQLRQSQKVEAVGQLTGGVAHDFNNLLTVIRGSVDLLRRPDLPEDRRRRYIDAIADTADRATKLTSQLLAFARRQALKAEVFDVRASVEGLRDMLGTLTGGRIAIRLDVGDEPRLIDADRSQFDTAIVNMAVNARDAMGGAGQLTVAVRQVTGMPAVRSHPAVPGDFIAIAITDTGTGIASEKIDRIFEPFYTTKGVGHGTGLGLSQVFGFAKQSGGDVIVESEVGHGSTFTLFLPRSIGEIERDASHAEGTGAIVEGTCVLVVEDNADVGAFATQALTELGYRTMLAVDGASALAELGRDGHGFDLVFSDVVMPGMSGIELGHEIRKRFPELPVVLTSGYSSTLAETDRRDFALLQKPYSIDELSRVLVEAVARRG